MTWKHPTGKQKGATIHTDGDHSGQLQPDHCQPPAPTSCRTAGKRTAWKE
jgi:hypothetical protein